MKGTHITNKGIEALNERAGSQIFPLQTIQSMAERWGVSRQTVTNWSSRHDDFPRELDGLIAVTAKTPKVYAFCDVEKYEKARGLA